MISLHEIAADAIIDAVECISFMDILEMNPDITEEEAHTVLDLINSVGLSYTWND